MPQINFKHLNLDQITKKTFNHFAKTKKKKGTTN